MNSREPRSSDESERVIRDAATHWFVRRDRGLTDHEAAEFAQWLKTDARHAFAFDRASAAWNRLGQMPESVTRPLADGVTRRFAWRWAAVGGLAAAILLGLSLNGGRVAQLLHRESAGSAKGTAIAGASLQTKVLPDGSLVRLNVGAEIVEQFTATERNVRLVRGEAHFTVTKNPARPFIVHAGEIAVRAVGTAFNVQLQERAVDVLVTEGKVQVDPPASAEKNSPPVAATGSGDSAGWSAASPLVVAGQHAVVTLATPSVPSTVVVSEAAPAELARALAWREPLLRLGGVTLAELAVEFERQTGRHLVLEDPALGSLHIGGRFRSDDVEGFVRVLEETYGIRSKREADGTILLGKEPSRAR